MAAVWVDRERRYFLSTVGTTRPSAPIVRHRWRNEGEINRKVELEITIPEVCAEYYDTWPMIDPHNRYRQDGLRLEKKIEAKDWSLCVNCALLGRCIVGAWNLHKLDNNGKKIMSKHENFCELADQVTDNSLDTKGIRDRKMSDIEQKRENPKQTGTGTHLMQTSRRRLKSGGVVSKDFYQERCNVCKGTGKSK